MRLLICTQKIDRNDPILGFFHLWVEEFSKYYEQVSVICLEKGDFNLPKNVSVYSLGKESGKSIIKYVYNFYHLIFKLRKNYDSVFVHMNPEYVCLGGLVWKFFNKKIGLWYTHREINLKLRIAEMFSDTIFTASKESFKLPSRKLQVVGHGIDTKKFPILISDFSLPLSILHLGRITKIKNIEVIAQVTKNLIDNRINIKELRLVGTPITNEDKEYKKFLQNLFGKLNISNLVNWDESNSDKDTFSVSTVSINSAPDGGMDKAVLASLAVEKPTFVSNQAFKNVFSEYWEMFSYPYKDSNLLTKKIENFINLNIEEKTKILSILGNKIRTEYGVEVLIKKIVSILK
jgi:glycosyltransferase involved in cell wall biosynthesis